MQEKEHIFQISILINELLLENFTKRPKTELIVLEYIDNQMKP